MAANNPHETPKNALFKGFVFGPGGRLSFFCGFAMVFVFL